MADYLDRTVTAVSTLAQIVSLDESKRQAICLELGEHQITTKLELMVAGLGDTKEGGKA